MKTLRQSMSWMHTWTGLLFGWVLYFMFVTGSVGYYDTEIDRWMQPERPAPVEVIDTAALFQTALDHAYTEAPTADRYFVLLPTTRSYSPYIRMSWNGTDANGKRTSGSAELLADGSIASKGRETGGGQALYRMHWTFHYIPRQLGEFIAGVAAFFMLAAIVSGIITHKKIFIDFFTLRLAKGQRSWLDAHNVVSVMTLPYQIMITYSGILFVGTLFFAPIIAAQYGVGKEARATMIQEIYGLQEQSERTGVSAPMVPLDSLVAEAQRIFPDEPITRMSVANPGDETAKIVVMGTLTGGIQRSIPKVHFNGVTGERIRIEPRQIKDGVSIVDVFEGLHEALFAGPILRILFFVSGLLGASMIATGLVLWTKKRRQKLKSNDSAERNLVIIERMNVGMIAGLPIAIAAYFSANRLLPLGIQGRGEWEIHTLFLVWGLAIGHSVLRPPRNGWTEQLTVAAIAFVSVPILNAATTSIHLGQTLPLPGRSGDFALAGVDLWLLLTGMAFGYAALVASKKAAIMPSNELRPVVSSAVEAQPAE